MQSILSGLPAMALVLLAGCGDGAGRDPAAPGPGVQLRISDGSVFTDPTDEEIRTVLGRLRVGPNRDAFAVLGRDEMTYVQVSGDSRVGFDLEYQLGSVDEHYRAARTDYTLDEVVAVFAGFRDGTVDWDAHGEWSKITF